MALMMDEEELPWFNETNVTRSRFSKPDSLIVIVSLSVIYSIIFVTGILGNITTCIVIGRNRSMHTDINFYLFGLAISDILLLICGLPLEVYRLWNPYTYPFSEAVCITIGLISETAANATVFTITAFTVERYIAICRPFFMSHKTDNLSRVIRYIIAIWACALCSAVPQVLQFGIISYKENGQIVSVCTVKEHGVHQLFAISSFIFFIVPVSLIIVLFVLIVVKLHTSRVLHPVKKSVIESGDRFDGTPRYRSSSSQRKVIRMLAAVALSFFLCWAPFHVQRLIAVYGMDLEHPTDTFYKVYEVLTFLSGVLYFLSTSINPFLYSIMSNRFRDAFKATLSSWCTRRERYRLERTYSDLLAERRERAEAIASQRPRNPPRNPRMLRNFDTASSQQCVAPPRAQVRSRFEKTHSALLGEQRDLSAARPLQRPYNQRMLRHFATASSRQFEAPTRAQPRFRFEKTQSALLEEQREHAAARVSQRTQTRNRRVHFATASSQQCFAPPQAQSLNRSNLTIVIEESESWLEKQRLAEGTNSLSSPQSISNSSLREVDQELSGEELATYLYQVNCSITGKTSDTSV